MPIVAIVFLATVTFTAPKFASPETARLVGADAPVTSALLVTLYGSQDGSDEPEMLDQKITMPGGEVSMSYDDRGAHWSLWASYTLESNGSRLADLDHSTAQIGEGVVKLSMNTPLIQTGVVRFSGTLPLRSQFSLRIWDVAGRLVATPYVQLHPGHSFSATWSAPHIRPGVYFAKLTSDHGSIMRRVIVLR